MKITAPALKLDMNLTAIVLRDSRPVIVCRIGSYDATTELSKSDIATFLKFMLKPKIFLAFAKVLFSKSSPNSTDGASGPRLRG